MEQSLPHSSLNSVQLHLLKMFSFCKQEKDLKELKSVLLEFYRAKVNKEAAELWESKELNDEKIEEMLHYHKHTPYLIDNKL
ncbi:hypothetical protein Barb4_00829 [Bacteroidales bacterium Barb4]|nr:hypothetical protein Barb4_00829 [Bacteroidales bacterium Barb4]